MGGEVTDGQNHDQPGTRDVTERKATKKRPSEFGNVRPSGRTGTFQARYKGPDGTTYYRSGFATKGAARAYLATVRGEILRGTWRSPKAPPLPQERRLDEYAEEWLRLRRKELRPSTQELYAGLLRVHILPTLGGRTLADLTPSVVKTWHSERQQATGPAAVRQAYVLLRAMMNAAVRDEILTRNPCQLVGAGQPRSEPRPYMSRETAEAIAATMPSEQLRTLILLKFWACLRLGEVLALRYGDLVPRLDKAGKPVLVVRVNKALVRVGSSMVEGKPKTRESVRDVPLPRQAAKMITAFMESRSALPSAYLFARSDAQPLRPHDVRRPFHAAQGELGLSGYHLHDLRHGGLTHAALQGATLGQLKSRAGHNNARMVAHYQRSAAELDDGLAAAMSDPEPVAEDHAGEG